MDFPGLAPTDFVGLTPTGFLGLTPPGYFLPPLRGSPKRVASERGDGVRLAVFLGLTPPGYNLPPLRGWAESAWEWCGGG